MSPARPTAPSTLRRVSALMMAAGVSLAAIGTVSQGAPHPALASTASPAPANPTPAPPVLPVAAPLPAPSRPGAYLGTFYHPTPDHIWPGLPYGNQKGFQDQLDALAAGSPFGSATNRSLRIVAASEPWDTVTNQAELLYTTQIQQAYEVGAVPLIEWTCGDSDGAVAGGLDDANILAFADQLRAAGGPVLLDWFPDAESASADPSCLASRSTPADGYRNAYQHIVKLFRSAGATNVSFVWSADPTDAWTTSMPFYPGAASVDWVAAQTGGPVKESGPHAVSVDQELGSWYQSATGLHKPLMISGLMVGKGAGQVPFLASLGAELPVNYSEIKAVVVDDAMYSPDTSFISDSAALTALAALPVFDPGRSPVQVTVAAHDNPVDASQVVKLWAGVDSGAVGGTVSFFDGGQPIEGCARVPLIADATCSASHLSTGVHHITVHYSGDFIHRSADSAVYDLWVSSVVSAPLLPTIPPAGRAYLGAWDVVSSDVSPTVTAVSDELANLPVLDAQLGRNVSLVHVYQSWGDPVAVSQLRQIMADGAIPLIDWRCGLHDDQILSGAGDALIDRFAAELASLHSPVLLRWYWEPNLEKSCQTASQPGGISGPDSYVAAFRYIHDRIVKRDGASNVAFVWAVSSVSPDQDLARYFPGSAYVDWVAVDGYYRKTKVPDAGVVDDIFSGWYGDYADSGLPMMISETGAETGGRSGSQAAYLELLKNYLDTHSRIRAVAYFDSATANFDYTLGASDGLPAFRALSNAPEFLPPRFQTAFDSMTASPTSGVVTGQEVTLTGLLGLNDSGGSLSFRVTGSPNPLPGCEKIPISLTISCNTDALPAGTNTISVTYTGDAEFDGAGPRSVTLAVTQGTPLSGPHRPRVPAGSAYLGAWMPPQSASPSGAAPLDVSTEMQSTNSTFGQSGGRPLSIVGVYDAWDIADTEGTQAVEQQFRAISATGAIPMVNWDCSPAANDDSIDSGGQDALITKFAEEMASAGVPMFLRFGGQPNDPAAQPCLGTSGAHGYQLAFQHIHDLFRAAGATNVAFVWSVATSGDLSNLTSFYPGSGYVDWIAADGYPGAYRSETLSPAQLTKATFGAWYAAVTSAAWVAKPLMIAETGQVPGQQSGYLTQLASDIRGGQFPAIKAIVYMDGPSRRSDGTTVDYTLDASGLATFKSLATSPPFESPRVTPQITVTPSAQSVFQGDSVVLTAAVQTAPDANDGGGAVTFVQDGQPIPSCTDLLQAQLTCTVTDVAPGQHTYAATFGGDTVLAPAASAVATVAALYRTTPTTSPPVSWATGAPGAAPAPGAIPTAAPDGPGLAFTGAPTIPVVSPQKPPALDNNYAGQPVPAVPVAGHPAAPPAGPLSVIPRVISRSFAGVPGGNWIMMGALGLALAGASYIVTTAVADRRRRKGVGRGLIEL